MDTGSFEVAGLVLRSPVTAGTNLVLGVTCVGFYMRIRRAQDERTRMWRRFFLALAAATLAGVPKHGLGYYSGSTLLGLVTLLSSVSGGVSTYYAQRATLVSGLFTRQGHRGLLWLVRLQLVAFVVQMIGTQTFQVVVVQSGLGLIGVLAAEVAARRRGHVETWWMVAGMATALLPGLAYIARWPSSPWFNHNDFAHVLLAVSLTLIFFGARIEARSKVIS